MHWYRISHELFSKSTLLYPCCSKVQYDIIIQIGFYRVGDKDHKYRNMHPVYQLAYNIYYSIVLICVALVPVLAVHFNFKYHTLQKLIHSVPLTINMYIFVRFTSFG